MTDAELSYPLYIGVFHSKPGSAIKFSTMNTEIRVFSHLYIAGLLINVLCLLLLEQDVLAEEKGLLDIPVVETIITLDETEQDIIWAALNRRDWERNNTDVVYAVKSTFTPIPIFSNYSEFAEFFREEGRRAKRADKWSQIKHSSFMEAIEDFLDKNKQIYEENRRFQDSMKRSAGSSYANVTNFVFAFRLPDTWKNKVVLLSINEMQQLFLRVDPNTGRRGGWEAFSKKYPKSPRLIGFSRLGISKDQTVAILYDEQSFSVFINKQNKWMMYDKFTGFQRLQ